MLNAGPSRAALTLLTVLVLIGGPARVAVAAQGANRDLGAGYWVIEESGVVHPFGTGSPADVGPVAVDLEPGPGGSSWALTLDGVVHPLGGAPHHGDVDMATLGPDEKVASMSALADGSGYWVFTDRGRALAFGAAPDLGDLVDLGISDRLLGPVVASVATPDGAGYYMLGGDGGVFAFGSARFAGSVPQIVPLDDLRAPLVGMIPDPDGSGYWLVAADGGLFSFDAEFRGSIPGVLPPGTELNQPVVGAIAYGNGYLMVASDGGVFNFSDLAFFGSLGATPPQSPVVSIAAMTDRGATDTVLASPGLNGASPDSFSLNTSVSGDGTKVVFESEATNLVVGDDEGFRDIFVRDLDTGSTVRVSVSSEGVAANGPSFDPTMSSDGRLVAFESLADNLVPDDTNGARDVFVHDLLTGSTTRVSVASDGGQLDGESFNPDFDGAARLVVFSSDADNVVPGDSDHFRDIFVHDLVSGTTEWLSPSADGGLSPGESDRPSIDRSGRFVAFSSLAENLVKGDTNGKRDIFVHDRQTGTVTLVTRAADGGPSDGSSFRADLSGDGRYVAFDSLAGNLVADDTNGVRDVFVHDLVTGTTSRASVSDTGGQAVAASVAPAISSDGRYVAFASGSPDLVEGDTNERDDIFRRDLVAGRTELISVALTGAGANGGSAMKSISDNGEVIAYTSVATNITEEDTGGTRAVFAFRDR